MAGRTCPMTRIGRLLLKSSKHGADQSGPVSGSSTNPHLLANSECVNCHPYHLSAWPAETADCPQTIMAQIWRVGAQGPCSQDPSGRITLDTRVIIADFSSWYAEMITRVSLVRPACDVNDKDHVAIAVIANGMQASG